jgi:cell division protein ZipA
MWELRWILAGLGAALLVVLYLWGRYIQQRAALSRSDAAGSTPLQVSDARDSTSSTPSPVLSAANQRPPEATTGPPTAVSPAPRREKIISLRLIPRSGQFSAVPVVCALQEAGLTRGRYGIFHYCAPDSDPEIFSVANLVEPGSFAMDDMDQSTLPGMTFFMVLPGPQDAVSRFDQMVRTARLVAVELNGELVDDRGSSWSIQRERYVREELIRYRLKPEHD